MKEMRCGILTPNHQLLINFSVFYDDFWHKMNLRACRTGTAWGEKKNRIFASVKILNVQVFNSSGEL
jgi:hypothetical protein